MRWDLDKKGKREGLGRALDKEGVIEVGLR